MSARPAAEEGHPTALRSHSRCRCRGGAVCVCKAGVSGSARALSSVADSSWRRQWQPLQCSGLESPMDSPWGRKGSDRTERLSRTLSCPMEWREKPVGSGAGPEGAVLLSAPGASEASRPRGAPSERPPRGAGWTCAQTRGQQPQQHSHVRLTHGAHSRARKYSHETHMSSHTELTRAHTVMQFHRIVHARHTCTRNAHTRAHGLTDTRAKFKYTCTQPFM